MYIFANRVLDERVAAQLGADPSSLKRPLSSSDATTPTLSSQGGDGDGGGAAQGGRWKYV